ncbi:MAG TPA: hypothetical protein VFB14_22205 [Bryobacteraceae bacterium]|jgi:hypothetical protein|nr:hypothetical protein [Bryobacteraceae bacterium]
MSNIIKVPKPSNTAYNPHRSLEKNLLIKRQVEHFREAEMQLPETLRTGIDIAHLKTEGQAGEYIRKVTKAIHQSGGREAGKVKTAR